MASNRKPVLTSLTRISDLAQRPFDVCPLPKGEWGTGNYVVGKVVSLWNARRPVELANGRMAEVATEDIVVGALGVRAATLEAVGDWRAVGPDLRLDALTAAGIIGKATSVSPFLAAMMQLTYEGHVCCNGTKVTMKDFVPKVSPTHYSIPTILLIGTSMSSGKTTSGKVIVRQLVDSGLRVAACKFTGAGRMRDSLAMGDAGAEILFDFVDVGLPSTVVPPDEYRESLRTLLALISSAHVDVVVAEAGASPLEPYNGDVLIDEIREQICCTCLCASDPYAVVGVTQGFGFKPDFVSGVCTSTSAGVDVISRLTGIEALNLLDVQSHSRLGELLSEKLAHFQSSSPDHGATA